MDLKVWQVQLAKRNTKGTLIAKTINLCLDHSSIWGKLQQITIIREDLHQYGRNGIYKYDII